ncbi:MAG: class I SAM-dependent methyltransferase, partial [Planctomycetota bacterium]
VFRSLGWIVETQPLIGRRFLEWGCGFATVACLASELGLASFGIEAHDDLVEQASETIAAWRTDVELVRGNFLPRAAESLADDPTLPSLSHGGSVAYEEWDLGIDDFAIIYSYPWPGESQFHEDVFDRYAEVGAILLMFIGPNDMRAYRKLSGG